MKYLPYIVLGAFGLIAVIAVLVLATTAGNKSGNAAPVVIWGTIPQAAFTEALNTLNNSALKVTYVQKDASTFDSVVANALAAGQGPDLILVGNDQILSYADKVLVIPYSSYSQSSFESNFVSEGNLFLSPAGVLAVPFTIDPLVMYYNQSLLNEAGISSPPTYWDQFLTMTPSLTQKNTTGSFNESALPFGSSQNVDHFKEILTALFLQVGDPIVTESYNQSTAQTTYNATLGQNAVQNSSGSLRAPAVSALDFFVSFGNPSSATYTWNNAMPDSLSAFVAGQTAFYIGFASELSEIHAKNPNLNFSVAMLPQVRPTAGQNIPEVTYGQIEVLAITKQSQNAAGAIAAIGALTSAAGVSAMASAMNLPPVRRDDLSVTPAGTYLPTFYQSALIASGWPDPNSAATSQIFSTLITSVTSGAASDVDAITSAREQLSNLVSQ